MLVEPHVHALARTLRACLERGGDLRGSSREAAARAVRDRP
jgi:hypothetical protein